MIHVQKSIWGEKKLSQMCWLYNNIMICVYNDLFDRLMNILINPSVSECMRHFLDGLCNSGYKNSFSCVQMPTSNGHDGMRLKNL